jgi:predicted nuclease of predicted toxin-antitoxin system
MARTIRFHLDEHVHPAIAEGLRLRGIDLTTTAEAGLLGRADTDQMAFALREGRVIYTNDHVFLALSAAGAQHPGIVYCHPQKVSIGAIVRGIALIWEVYEPEDLRNRVEYL